LLVNNDTELSPGSLDDPATFDAAWREYQANRTGPLTMNAKNCRAMLSLRNLTSSYQNVTSSLSKENAGEYLTAAYKNVPELVAGYKAQKAIIAKIMEGGATVYEYTFGGTSNLGMRIQKPLSRGTIMISSRNPHPEDSPPLIDFQSMTHPLDMQLSILGFKFGRKVMSSTAMKALQVEELTPGPGITSDTDLESLFRSTLMDPSNAHPVGTAAMMPRELGGVVDPQLRVYGIESLRVVDASIMPLIPTAHTQATMYAVAEKAADLIKGVYSFK
jgi:choline dehydrogenase-like flavoprotein